jgi:hypothetical protein
LKIRRHRRQAIKRRESKKADARIEIQAGAAE